MTERVTTGVSPHLTILEGKGEEAVAFYARAFGAEEANRHLADDGKRLMHAGLRINGGWVLLNDDFVEYSGGTAPPSAVTIHLEVDDADSWWNRAVEAGAIVRVPLADQFWGQRYGQLVDPFGHCWSIGGPVAD